MLDLQVLIPHSFNLYLADIPPTCWQVSPSSTAGLPTHRACQSGRVEAKVVRPSQASVRIISSLFTKRKAVKYSKPITVSIRQGVRMNKTFFPPAKH